MIIYLITNNVTGRLRLNHGIYRREFMAAFANQSIAAARKTNQSIPNLVSRTL
jgi:hypothetical protein